MSSPEEKRVIVRILLLYLLTTGTFVSVFLGLYYDRGRRLIFHEKSAELREDYAVPVRLIEREGRFDSKVLEALEASGANMRFNVYDANGKILHEGIKTSFKNLEGNKRKVFIQDGYVFMRADLGKRHKRHGPPRKRDFFAPLDYEILIQGAYVGGEIWALRFKTFGLLALSLPGIGVIAYFLLKFALRPLRNRIESLNSLIKAGTHEINTPVSVILMSVERLKDKDVPEEIRAHFRRISIAARTIAGVYQNLVFHGFSSMSGPKTDVDVKRLLEQRLEFFAPLMEQKNLRINLNLNEAFIFANEAEIGCVIDNLLSNAIKYNKKSGYLRISLHASELCIEDGGCGMSEKEKSGIFLRYVRFNAAQGGFGIGLALVKEICDRLNVEIRCESKPLEGSVFTLKWSGPAPKDKAGDNSELQKRSRFGDG